jgi:RNA polymerase sigma-70 factor (ECF subfamily)
LDRRALNETLMEALEDLDPAYRLPVILADLEGFSYKEIAEILEVPLGTVMSRLYRGRKRMEHKMGELGDRYWRDESPRKSRNRDESEEPEETGLSSDQEFPDQSGS